VGSHEQKVVDRNGVDLDDPRRIAAAIRLEQSVSGNEVLDRLSGLAARLLNAGSAQVSLLTDVQVVAGGVGLGAVAMSHGPTARQDSLCGVTAASDRPLVIEDAHRDARVDTLPPVLAGAVGSYLGVPLADGDGFVVGAFCVYDRSARSWSESEILVLTELAAATTAELERSAAEAERDLARLQFALAMESGGIGSWEWDLQARRMTANSQLLAMFGLPEDLEHKPVPVSTFIAAVHPADRERVAASVDAALDRRGEYAQEYRVLQPGGGIRWIAARGRPLYDDARRAVRLVGAAYDTTDRHLAAENAQSESTLMALIARASDLLAGSLEAEDAVRSFARLVVPVLADWSVVSIVGEDGHLRDVDWWHHDPAKLELAGVFARHRLEGRSEPRGSLAALSSGEPFVKNAGAFEFALGTLKSQEAIEALRALGLQSVGCSR
jgi:PAS domain S-box-containing protein